MAILRSHRLITLFAFVSMCVLLSAIRLAKDKINVGSVMELQKSEDHEKGYSSAKYGAGRGTEVISHQEVVSPGDDEGLEWMDYSSTRRKTPIHN